MNLNKPHLAQYNITDLHPKTHQGGGWIQSSHPHSKNSLKMEGTTRGSDSYKPPTVKIGLQPPISSPSMPNPQLIPPPPVRPRMETDELAYALTTQSKLDETGRCNIKINYGALIRGTPGFTPRQKHNGEGWGGSHHNKSPPTSSEATSARPRDICRNSSDLEWTRSEEEEEEK